MKKVLLVFFATLISLSAFAEGHLVKASLKDKDSGEGLGFATVSLTIPGKDKPTKYVLSDEEGKVLFEGVRKGKYIFKAELLGYVAVSRDIEVKDEDLDLGTIKVAPDSEQLDAAKVSAVGNPIIVKKDTIEFNANSFKTTDNDVLEDLLKKLPGVEVSEDGSITVNGQTVSKITIDGKTFFLDDPQLASKNLPAKMINKLKVVEKKSEQAEFTGIDDGERETVIDLSVKPGMMRGFFGNVSGGVGHDIPSDPQSKVNDYRYQGAGFMGKFTKDTQISVILNANNTNNRGFNDLQGSMMGNAMGGGGRMGRGQGGWGDSNGIITSYMGGLNGAFTLLDGNMDLAGNYLYNHTNTDVEESSIKNTYLSDYNLLYNSNGISNQQSGGHRFGVRLEHKFSENTSILFEPQVNFGTGSYVQSSVDTTYRDNLDGSEAYRLNNAYTNNTGDNKSVSTSGFMLLRQRLGIPGRTITAMSRYSFSNNDLAGINDNGTTAYSESGSITSDEQVKQNFETNQKSSSVFARLTYTEPLGNHFYVEANYAYRWSKNTSDKTTYDLLNGGAVDELYSNKIINRSVNQEIGANALYQNDAFRAQAGFSAQPTDTYNSTTKAGTPQEYHDFHWNFSPQVMFWGDFNENANGRLFYRGRSNQPSTSQLMPVPDNTDPLNVSFGNPTLKPYFSHNISGDFRYNNKKAFSSCNFRFEGGFTQAPIVSAMWYGNGGEQYSMPFNGPTSANASINGFANIPIARSNFSLSNVTRASWSKSSSYVGTNIDMSSYDGTSEGFYNFMEEFAGNFNDPTYFASHITTNTTQSFSFTERLRGTYRTDDLELTLSGRTRMNKAWYTIATTADNTTTWNNQIRASANWTVPGINLTFKSEFNYNWYNGYSTEQPSEYVLNAELQKGIFRNKCTLALKGYDIFDQAKNLNVSDTSNYHKETRNNTLGRYVILSLTYRFGNFGGNKGGRGMRGPGGMGGPGGPPPMR